MLTIADDYERFAQRGYVDMLIIIQVLRKSASVNKKAASWWPLRKLTV